MVKVQDKLKSNLKSNKHITVYILISHSQVTVVSQSYKTYSKPAVIRNYTKLKCRTIYGFPFFCFCPIGTYPLPSLKRDNELGFPSFDRSGCTRV